mmetsp:Transcript_26877/g.65854  ORF Transcript_26877/g.65854 Transcript_26877/m.65854 type:complete len:313 (+) Transcript_26877:675-1613(+)
MLAATETATCKLCNTADDTVGHRLGGCACAVMQGLYVKRHDHVVKTLAGAFQKASNGGYAVEYNAGTGGDGSTHTMVHERLLRSARPRVSTRARGGEAELDGEARALLKLKPDVVIYHGLRQEELRDFLDGKKDPPKGMKVKILEVGYCNDWNWERKIEEKSSVYEPLVSRMKKCGWKVEYKQVALGTRGSVYSHLTDALCHMVGSTELQNKEGRVREIALHGASEGGVEGATYIRVVIADRAGGSCADIRRVAGTRSPRVRAWAKPVTGVRAKAWCPLIHADASLSQECKQVETGLSELSFSLPLPFSCCN